MVHSLRARPLPAATRRYRDRAHPWRSHPQTQRGGTPAAACPLAGAVQERRERCLDLLFFVGATLGAALIAAEAVTLPLR